MKSKIFYFNFLLFLLATGYSFAQVAPGGVNTNLKLWNKADAGVAVSGSNVTGWTDQTATNTFTVTGTPTLQSANLNYNPTILFNGSSRFTGNTSITAITHGFVVGKIVNASGVSGSGALMGGNGTVTTQYFFHTEGGKLYCGNLNSVYTGYTSANSIAYSLLSEDLNQSGAANDKIRLNGTAQTNAAAGDPAPFNATPTLGSRFTENILSGSELAEAVIYNTSLNATQISRVESYLAIKYGITLPNNYLNSAGTTIYNVSSYASNIIGIGRDDSTSLNQKQSHQSDDSTRIYLGTLAAANASNATVFSGHNQYVMMGNDGATLANNISNTEYPSGFSIISRLNREWKITNTGFTGTFSIDITPVAGVYSAYNMRVLLDDDGNFTDAAIITPTVTYSAGKITISGITNSMIASGATKYLTVAFTSSPGGVNDNLYLWTKADVGVSVTGSNVSQWLNMAGSNMTTQASKTASAHVTLNSNDFNYNPTLVFDGTNNEVLSGQFTTGSTNAAMLFAVVKRNNLNTVGNSNPYSLGAAGASGIGYFAGSYYIDRSGGQCAATANAMNIPGVVRADYSSSSDISGATTAFNGLVTVSDCGSNALTPVNGTFQIGGRTFGSQPTRVFSGEIAEVIHFNADNMPNTTTDINKVETYLAIKYGITLDNSVNGTLGGNYSSSAGTTVWTAAANSSYHHNIIGIGRDDNSSLLQKQSHEADDSTRIYLGTLAASNQLNATTISGDGQFVLVGNNQDALFNTGSNEYPSGLYIANRLSREWKITNTGFTGTFSMDIKSSSLGSNASTLRVLIDDDGDFSNATMILPTVTYSGGVITISGINNAMVPAGSTKYLAVVGLATPGGVSTGLYLWTKGDAGVTATSGQVTQWTNQVSTPMTTQPSKSASANVTYNATAFNYNPTVVFDGTSSQRLVGAYVTAPAGNPIIFVAAKKTGTTANLADMMSISTGSATGGIGLQYNSSGSVYAVDGPGITCSFTANIDNVPAVGRATYTSSTSIVGAFTTLNGTNSTGSCSGSFSMDAGFEIGGRTYASQPQRVYNGNIAEVLHYNGASLSATDTAKIESYLAVKYGVGLTHNYLNAAGGTIYNVSTYPNNIIGIGRDDNSALLQKQSHNDKDSIRIYLSSLVTSNAGNTGTFSSDNQFVLMGDDGGAFSNTGSIAYPAGIGARLTRQWKITNSNFGGTFSIDLKPASLCTVNVSEFRLLVNAGTNFTTGTTVYSAADGLSFSYAGGVITIGGITTAMIPTNTSQYLTLATTTFASGTATASQTILANSSPADLLLSGNGGAINKWQYSSDNFASDVHDIAASASTTLTSAQMGVLITSRYYRAVSTNSLCATANTASVLISVNSAAPGGVKTSSFWTRADYAITQSGGAVSEWDDISGGGFKMIQPASGKQPVLTSDTLNYYAVPAFDAVDDLLEDSTHSFNSLLNVTTGTNTTTTGSVFTVARAKSLAADGRIFYQWNRNAAGAGSSGNYYMQSYIDNTTGNYKIGGRSAWVGNNTIPATLPPFIGSSLEAPGANGAVHYYNGGKEKITTNASILISTNTTYWARLGTFLNGYVAEAITYKTKLTDIQRRQVESYLALKYAITIDTTTNGSSSTTFGDYIATDGTTTYWDASLGGYSYHNNVIGIGRDDSTALYQKQSHQLDDSVRIYLNTLTTTNSANAGTFSSNKQFVMMGATTGLLRTGSTEYPAGISSRLYREWKITNTAFTGTFSVDIKPTIVCTPNIDRFRLLVDADGDFSSGATTYSSTDGLTFVNSGGVISVQGITTSMIPANSTRYIALATAPLTGGTATPPQTICAGNSPSDLTVASSIGSLLKWQYSSDNFSADINDIAGSNVTTLTTAQLAAPAANRYYRSVVQDGFCATANSSSVLISVNNTNTWVGTTSTDWNTPANWSCNYVPLITTDVVVPQVNTNNPVLSTGDTGRAHHLTVNNGGSLTIQNMRMQIAGTLMNNGGILDAVEGSVELKGASAQTIAGSMFKDKTIKNLISSNSTVNVSATVADTLKISGALSFGNINNATINTGDNITLLSNCGTAITARLADITNNGSNSGNVVSGKVVVERCIPAYRAWRLLAAPIAEAGGAPSISTAWQEGAVDAVIGDRVNPHPGYGAHITGGPDRNVKGVGNTEGNGFDAGPNSASIFYFGSNKAWVVPATTSYEPITNHSGYLLFVRGDRSTNLTQTIYAPSSNTILRPKGGLKQNNQAYNFSGAAGLELVGNPFASSINFNTVTKTGGMADYYYAWDPMMTGSFGVGAFVAMTPDGFGNYEAVPNPQTATANNVNPHSINTTGTIQSGSAFIVYHSAVSSSLVVKETDKIGTGSQVFMRPITGAASVEKIKVNLYTAAESILLDGTLTMFNDLYQDDVTNEDVSKMANLAENLALSRGSNILSIEKRQPLKVSDTIYLGIYKMKEKSYKLEFICSNINQPGLTAYLEDNYLKTRTIVPLDGIATVQFTTYSEAGSKAADRFRIVFEQKQVVLPVTFVSIDAKWQNENIAVMWKSANEIGIKNYTVEKSADGIHFTKTATVAPAGNNGNTLSYNWIDDSPKENNYYRIVAVEADGKEQYSKIVNLKANLSKPSVKLIDDQDQNMISYQFNNMQGGKYGVSFMNMADQSLQVSVIDFNGGTSKENVQVKQELAAGMYIVKMTMPDGSIYSAKIIRK